MKLLTVAIVIVTILMSLPFASRGADLRRARSRHLEGRGKDVVRLAGFGG